MALVLVVNAGSRSLKLAAVAADGTAAPVESLDAVPAGIEAVGHRVVHGGERFRDAVVVDGDVERALRDLVALAPLHNPPALDGLARARRALPDVPHVAVFDTAFHATIPPEAATYAVPRRWREEWGIRRYGFHGLSVEWAAERVAAARLVVCHLGGGCSVTAVRDGRSVDTTMGFTPLEGVPMATRSGTVDPGAVLHVLRDGRAGREEVEQALEHESGLLGLGGSADVRELLADGGDDARLALAVFAYRVAAAVGAMAVALGGLDALAFTAGVGERAAPVRAAVCGRLGFLGVALDGARNEAARPGDADPQADIGAAGSAVRVVALRTREDVVIARAVRRVLAA